MKLVNGVPPASQIAVESVPCLILYAEDALLADGRAGTGLSKALTPLVTGIADSIAAMVVHQTHEFYPSEEVQQLAGVRSVIAGRMHYLLAKITGRLPLALAWPAATLHGMVLGVWLRGALPNCAGMRLWSAIGVDVLSLVRLRAVARTLGAKFDAYLVDDIEEHPHNRRWRQALSRRLPKLLSSADRLFAITPQLSEHLSVRHGAVARVLPLIAPSEPTHTATGQSLCDEFFAVYLGSINHLYADGLLELIAHIERLRRDGYPDLRLRCVAPVAQLQAILQAELPDWIVCGRVDSDAQLRSLLANSRFAYLPYSFDAEAHAMISSSFPSKLLEYLASAKAIVVYAPRHSVPASYLDTADVPYVVSEEGQLGATLDELARHPSDHGDRYRELLRRRHSTIIARQLILDSVGATIHSKGSGDATNHP